MLSVFATLHYVVVVLQRAWLQAAAALLDPAALLRYHPHAHVPLWYACPRRIHACMHVCCMRCSLQVVNPVTLKAAGRLVLGLGWHNPIAPAGAPPKGGCAVAFECVWWWAGTGTRAGLLPSQKWRVGKGARGQGCFHSAPILPPQRHACRRELTSRQATPLAHPTSPALPKGDHPTFRRAPPPPSAPPPPPRSAAPSHPHQL